MTPDDVAHAIANALQPLTAEIPELQVYWYYNPNPTPPSLDVIAGDPFQLGAGFGTGNSRVYYTVRALVSDADLEAAHQLLYRLLDPAGPASVEKALHDDGTAVLDNAEGHVSGITPFADAPGCLGSTWRVGAYLT